MFAISLKTVDLQVLLPRLEQTARVQEQPQQQGQLRNHFAFFQQQQMSQKKQRVPMSPRGENALLLPRDNKKEGTSKLHLKRKRGKKQHSRGDPLRGNRFDRRV